MADLITTAELKTWLNITGSGEDTRLAAAVSAASKQTQNYCKATLLAKEWREHADGTGTNRLWLKERPIQRIISVRGPNRINALQVKFTGTANFASAEVIDDTSLRLTSSASGTVTTTPLAFSTYKTLTTLAAAVAATSGWTTQVNSSDADIQESKELLPQGMGDALDSWLILDSADEPVDGYHWFDWGEMVYRNWTWAAGTFNWHVRYIAGFGDSTASDATNIAALPEDLKLWVKELAAMHYLARDKHPDLRSEHLGNYGYSLSGQGESGPSGMPLRIERGLAPYKRQRQ